jgi:LPXTG-motif cell wall-anchored protein
MTMKPWISMCTLAVVVLPVRADDLKDELDSASDAKALQRVFQEYGFNPKKSILREPQSVRIRLPSYTKDVGQTGLYSFVALAGNFKFYANFEILTMSPPDKGYGTGCGIGIEADNGELQVTLQRGYLADKGKSSGYIVSVRKRDEKGVPQWEPVQHFPSGAKKGRIALHREKTEIVCLATDRTGDEPVELCRVPFVASTVRRARLFADQGGALAALDIRLSQFGLKAEEITGGIAKRDQPGSYGWWLTIGGLLIVTLIGIVVYRRRKDED